MYIDIVVQRSLHEVLNTAHIISINSIHTGIGVQYIRHQTLASKNDSQSAMSTTFPLQAHKTKFAANVTLM